MLPIVVEPAMEWGDLVMFGNAQPVIVILHQTGCRVIVPDGCVYRAAVHEASIDAVPRLRSQMIGRQHIQLRGLTFGIDQPHVSINQADVRMLDQKRGHFLDSVGCIPVVV